MAEHKTIEELAEFIEGLATKEHDYNTSAEALAEASEATFNYISSKLGNSGFQAGWAALELLRRTQRIKGPFGIVKAEDMLYPQYDNVSKVVDWEQGWKEWATERAFDLLYESEHREPYEDEETGHVYESPSPSVRAKWEKLVLDACHTEWIAARRGGPIAGDTICSTRKHVSGSDECDCPPAEWEKEPAGIKEN